jgi:hypothetical protein
MGAIGPNKMFDFGLLVSLVQLSSSMSRNKMLHYLCNTAAVPSLGK